MPNLKPWYKVVTPREDLRESKPLDASEFAVHLDQVRDGRAPTVYRNADEFLDRTYLTRSLLELAGQVVRRLSGEKTETSAVFNLATQFGGGKTHALTLLYHLAKNGPKSHSWTSAAGGYDPFVFGISMSPQEVEISEDVYVITAETAEAYKQSASKPPPPVGTGNLFKGGDGQPTTTPGNTTGADSTRIGGGERTPPPPAADKNASLRWSGEVPAQKWMNFYTKVLSRFATTKSLRLTVTVEVAPDGGVSKQAAEETKTALRELGLKDDVQ